MASRVRMVRPRKKARGRLTPEEVYELRVQALRGVTHALLARRYGVAQSTITRAVHGDTHARVPLPVEIDYGGVRPLGAPRYHSYSEAVEQVARASDGEVEVVENLGRYGVAGLLKVVDRLAALEPELLRRQTAARAREDHWTDPRRS